MNEADPLVIAARRDASIHWENNSCDPTGFLFVCEEEHGLGDVTRLPVSPQGVELVERLHLFRTQDGIEQRSLPRTRLK